MTASYDFNHYLLAGHGRAYFIAKENPERYRDRIMSACRKDYAFDMQCEGSRAFHTYDLVSLFDDPEPFIAAAEESYADPETDENWNQLCHLTDLLLLLGQRETVIKKYKHLEKQLRPRASVNNGGLIQFSRNGPEKLPEQKRVVRIGEPRRYNHRKQRIQPADFAEHNILGNNQRDIRNHHRSDYDPEHQILPAELHPRQRISDKRR